MTTILIIPGLDSSGPRHWQTWFEKRVYGCVRVRQTDWSRPDLTTWAKAVRRDVARATGPVWMVAHSFGCLAAVQAGWDLSERIAGAMLVAPADPDTFDVAHVLPDTPLDFPSELVASRNDPWMRFGKAAQLADNWRSDLVDLGAAGHINVEAGYGAWPDGIRILGKLRRRARHSSIPRLADHQCEQRGDLEDAHHRCPG